MTDGLLYLAVVVIWGTTWIMIKFQIGVVPPEDALTPQAFQEQSGVSRETQARLEAYVAMLRKWNGRRSIWLPICRMASPEPWASVRSS